MLLETDPYPLYPDSDCNANIFYRKAPLLSPEQGSGNPAEAPNPIYLLAFLLTLSERDLGLVFDGATDLSGTINGKDRGGLCLKVNTLPAKWQPELKVPRHIEGEKVPDAAQLRAGLRLRQAPGFPHRGDDPPPHTAASTSAHLSKAVPEGPRASCFSLTYRSPWPLL
ncbi:hypothetical protein EV182_000258 [Spiromyces aspiralis]|uniref:Uncharacterized protein n=1 Tax=Spiromyces aspiralis TaxID=68401 RepID=A0ACC1HW80_9FUNG|nr:hypothetical protein EV182_000258 [Spiromyces aspiralis]